MLDAALEWMLALCRKESILKRKKIGVDLDNTLINYGPAYGFLVAETLDDHQYSLVKMDKAEAKKTIVARKGNDAWTTAQGKLYSEYLKYAEPFPGAQFFFEQVIELGHEVVIISHKTKYPYMGPQVNLQEIAMRWLEDSFSSKTFEPQLHSNLFFEEEFDYKINRILSERCDIFIDDLEEILVALPESIRRIHFYGRRKVRGLTNVCSWYEVLELMQ